MEGCGPCNATRPEWNKIKNILEKKYKNVDNVVVVDVNKDYINDIKSVGEIDGYPTMKYISDKGNKVENYEEERDVRSFINWIESNMKNNKQSGGSSVYNLYRRLTLKRSKSKSRKSKSKRSKSKRTKSKSKSKKNNKRKRKYN